MIMRDVSRAAVERWGMEDQMLMVAEEALELSHAVLKHRRALKKYNESQAILEKAVSEEGLDLSHISLDRRVLKKNESTANLTKAIRAVQLEAMQTLFMLDQLQVMLPGNYESVLETVLADAAQRLRNRGVDI